MNAYLSKGVSDVLLTCVCTNIHSYLIMQLNLQKIKQRYVTDWYKYVCLDFFSFASIRFFQCCAADVVVLSPTEIYLTVDCATSETFYFHSTRRPRHTVPVF